MRLPKKAMVDAAAMHDAKTHHFGKFVRARGLDLRPDVLEVIAMAKYASIRLGRVTTTGADMVNTVFAGLAGQVLRSDFVHIGDRSRATYGKPAPDIYLDALQVMTVAPGQAVVIEDTPESAQAALVAGIRTIAFPGKAAKGRAFCDSAVKVDRLSGPLVLGADIRPLAVTG